MSKKAPATPFTYDDYLSLPDDGRRYEVMEGELCVTPAPVPRHQEIQTWLASLLIVHVRNHSLGKVYTAPIDVVLSMVDIVQPDILFIAKDRLQTVARKNIVGTPDLIVEILSLGSSERDRVNKLALYERYALPEYWIVDPDAQTIEVYLLTAGRLAKVETLKMGDQLRARQIPGLVLKVAEIFN